MRTVPFTLQKLSGASCCSVATTSVDSLGIDARLPLAALRRQVSIVDKRAADQEVGLDELDQRFDAALLIGRLRPTRRRMEIKLGGQLQE